MRNSKIFVIFGATLGLASGFGPVFLSVAGIFLKPMADSFNWSRADVSLLSTLAMIGVAFISPFVGKFADKKGWSLAIGLSILFLCIGLLAISFAPASYIYIIIVGFLIGVGGAATTAVGYNSVIAIVFQKRLGLTLGVAMAGSGLGSIVFPVFLGKLLTYMGWREACLVVAFCVLFLGIISHQLIFKIYLKNSVINNSFTVIPKEITALNNDDNGIIFSLAARNYRFWIIGLTGLLMSMVSVGSFVHLASYFSDKGFNPIAAGQFVALYGLGLSLGRIGVGLIIDFVFGPRVAFIIFLVGALGFCLLAVTSIESVLTLYLATFLIGVAGGAEGDFIPFFARKYFGLKAFGAVYGAMFACFTIGSALGPVVYGIFHDLTNSYLPIFIASAGLCVFCAFLIVLLGRYQFK